MTTKDILQSKLFDYLEKQLVGFKYLNNTKKLFTCPICKQERANLIPTGDIFCLGCNKHLGDIFKIVKLVEPNRDNCSEEEISKYLMDLFEIQGVTETDVDKILDFYEVNGFDLVAVARNAKNPIEKDWTNKSHKDKKEWKYWLSNGLNIGLKTGSISNVTVIDVDREDIPQELLNLIPKNVLKQKTNKGWHFIFKFVKQLPKTRIEDLKIDIENEGGQIVVYPSRVDNIDREMTLGEVLEMPVELISYLEKQITLPNLKSFSEKLREDISTENFNLNIVEEGNRTNFLLHLGGILRKEMNVSQVEYTLNIVNRHFCKPPLPQRELDNIINSLDKYATSDDIELAQKILQYMKIVEEAGSRDIKEALGELGADGKQRIEKAIKYLVKEGFLYKKSRLYRLIKKAEWKDTFLDDSKVIDYQMPYFDEVQTFRNSDMIIIGGTPKCGKTHIALNIVKQLVKQGKKPYYISLESGNRFTTISMALNMAEGDFNWAVHFSPESIELEKNAITIIDWLLPADYAETDKLFKHFAEQLVRNGGTLIVFVQLKDDGDFFAKNMIAMFPALVARYLYDDEEKGDTGYFYVDYMREPKVKAKRWRIPCRYDFDTKELTVINTSQNCLTEEPKEFNNKQGEKL